MQTILDKTLSECLAANPNITIRDLIEQAQKEYEEEFYRISNQNDEIIFEEVVEDLLKEIGIPSHLKGYHYIKTALIITVEDSSMIEQITKVLYPTIAKEHKTTSSKVERAIRHAIQVAWDRGDVDILNEYFGSSINNKRGRATNAEFIARISDKLRLKLKKGKN